MHLHSISTELQHCICSLGCTKPVGWTCTHSKSTRSGSCPWTSQALACEVISISYLPPRDALLVQLLIVIFWMASFAGLMNICSKPLIGMFSKPKMSISALPSALGSKR